MYKGLERGINDITPEEWDSMTWNTVQDEIEEVVQKNAKDKQVGGNHYKDLKIQPAEFCYINNIPYLEATAIKYLCRWRKKGGVQDLDKAIHFIELLKEFESANNT